MYEKGETVVHPKHGAGIVIGIKTVQRSEEMRRYLCIDLNDSNGSVLWIPEERLDELEIRSAMSSLDIVKEIMRREPSILDDNYRARQADIKDAIKRGNPRDLIRALRDLSWRERTDGLTSTDQKLMTRIRKRLMRELALMPGMTKARVGHSLQQIIEDAMTEHLDRAGLAQA